MSFQSMKITHIKQTIIIDEIAPATNKIDINSNLPFSAGVTGKRSLSSEGWRNCQFLVNAPFR